VLRMDHPISAEEMMDPQFLATKPERPSLSSSGGEPGPGMSVSYMYGAGRVLLLESPHGHVDGSGSINSSGSMLRASINE